MKKPREGRRLHSCRWEVTKAQMLCLPVPVGRKVLCFFAFLSFMVRFFQLCGSYKYRASITVKDCKLKCSILSVYFSKSTAKQIFSLLHMEQKLFGA